MKPADEFLTSRPSWRLRLSRISMFTPGENSSAFQVIPLSPALAKEIEQRGSGIIGEGAPRDAAASGELLALRESVLSEVDRRGGVIVAGLEGNPETIVLGLASLVGTVGIPIDEVDAGPLVMDIRPSDPVMTGAEVSSRTATPFDLHTDLSYVDVVPDLITMLCVRPDPSGTGLTIIADAWECVAELSPQTIAELEKPQFTFEVPPRCRGGVLNGVAILGRDADGYATIRIRFDKVHAPTSAADAAIHELQEIVQRHRVEFFLDKDCAYIIDNRRLLHGRTGITFRGDDTDRLLKRVYGMRKVML